MNCFGIVVAVEYYPFRSQSISHRSHNSRNGEERIIQDLSRALAKRHCALKQHHMTTANTIYISNVFSNLLFFLTSLLEYNCFTMVG